MRSLSTRIARRVRGATTAIASAAVVAAGLAVGGALTAPEAQAQSSELAMCAEHELINVPGGVGSLAGVPSFVPLGGLPAFVAYQVKVAELPQNNVNVHNVNYTATPFLTKTYDAATKDGLQIARNELAQRAAACPNTQFSFIGYSEGADIVAQLAHSIGHGSGPIPAERVRGVAMISSPWHGSATDRRGGAPGHAVGLRGTLDGGFGALADRTMEVCRAGDIVCDPKPEWREFTQQGMNVTLRSGLGDLAQELRGFGLQDNAAMLRGNVIHTQYDGQISVNYLTSKI